MRPPGTEPLDAILSKESLVRGARWFGILTVLGLGALVLLGGKETFTVLGGMSPGFIALAVTAAAGDLLIGPARYQIFLRRIRTDSPFSLPIRADLANRFAGALTPSQTGGGPAQLYILHRGGVPVVQALAFLAINFLATMAVFLVTGGFAAWLLRDAFPGPAVTLLVRWAFFAFVALGGVTFLALVRPDLLERMGRVAVGRWEGSPGRVARLAHGIGLWVVENLGRYRATCTRFVREEPILVVWSLLLTVLLYANKFSLGWLIIRGLGVDAPYLDVVAVQALLQLVLFVAPSPGGSGIAELTTAALMAPFLETHLLAAFTAIFRCLLLYAPAALGCVVLLATISASPTLPPRRRQPPHPPLPLPPSGSTQARAPGGSRPVARS